MHENEVTRRILGAAIRVHRALGPGLIESVYEECLFEELLRDGLRVARQAPVPVRYRGRSLSTSLRLDLLVEGCVIVEIKAVACILEVHKAQLLSYLRLSDLRVGLLLNFHVPVLRQGITRMVNRFPDGVAEADPPPFGLRGPLRTSAALR